MQLVETLIKMLGEGNYSTPPGPGVQPGKFDQSSQNTTTTTTDPELIIMMTERRKKRKENNKRRFSDQQIKSLETIFETESKLQPPKKLQLAEELGLHPRQVAIWFQNRRARWKSKQLEHDYSILRANYHALDSRFQSLKKEKQSLVAQLQKLNELVQKQHAESSSSRLDLAGNSVEGDSGNGEHSCELAEADHSIHLEEADRGMQSSPSEENRRIHGCFRQQEPDLNMVEPPHEAFTSPENWCSFDSRNPLCQSSTDSQWWDFWT